MIKTERNCLTGILRWPTARAKKWVQDFLTAANADKNVLAVIAVGSCVRPGVTSLDLDILVICQNAAEFFGRAPMEVDVRKFEAAHIDEEIGLANDLLGWCVKFGVVLFERSHYWTLTSERWRDRVPLPSAIIARKRAEDTKRRMQQLAQIGDNDAALEQQVSYYTHVARATLVEHGVYPASRPELSDQLEKICEFRLANKFRKVLQAYRANLDS